MSKPREWWIDTKENRVVASPGGYVSDYVLNPRNGCIRVIEATPAALNAEELLDACRAVWAAYNGEGDMKEAARDCMAAIEKAEGWHTSETTRTYEMGGDPKIKLPDGLEIKTDGED